jgi:hypothetical protein
VRLTFKISLMSACIVMAGCGKSPTYEVKGPNAEMVAAIIAAKDEGNLGRLNSMISGVKYTEGVFDLPSATRAIRVSDIPPSDRENCKLAQVIGRGNVVSANWDCECCDVALDRQFLFEGGKLVEVQNIYALLG